MHRLINTLLCCLSISATLASPPKIIRVTQKPSLPAFQYGPAVALSHKLLAVGSPAGPGVGNVLTGRVDIYEAASGKLVRSILPADGAANDGFGLSLAIQGDILLVGAPLHQGGRGAVYTYNAATGKLLSKFMHPTIFNAEIGRSVALEGKHAAAGGTAYNADQGMVAVFAPLANVLLQDLFASDGLASDSFGDSVNITSGVVSVGAPGKDVLPGPVNNAGCVYLFEAETGVEAYIFKASAPIANEGLGESLATAGDLLLAGASGVNPGAAYVFGMQNIGQVRRITPPANITKDFGSAVATSGHLAIISATDFSGSGMAYFDIKTGNLLSTYTTGWEAGRKMAACDNRLAAAVVLDGSSVPLGSFGAVHLISPISSTEPLEHMASTGDPVYARAGKLGAINEAYSNPTLGMSFLAGISGSALAGSTGIWRDSGNFTIPVIYTKTLIESSPDIATGKISALLANQPAFYVLRTSLTGQGINSTNNSAVGVVDLAAVDQYSILRQTGDTVNGGISGLISGFNQVLQSYHASADIAMTVNLKKGTNGVHAANDSAVLVTDASAPNANLGIVIEGQLEPGASPAVLGQIHPHVTFPDQTAIFTAGRTGVLTDLNVGLYAVTNTGAKTRISTKGDIVSGLANPATVGAYIGIGLTTTGSFLSHLTLGSPATAVNNEILVHSAFAGLNDVLRKGADHPDIVPTVQWKRFLSMHPCHQDQVIFHAQLQGNGVTPANDGIICLIQNNGTILTLMREGDAIPGGDGARVGNILKIDTISSVVNGHYLILCSLTGGPASSNLALFTGESTSGNPGPMRPIRRPFLRLRKGQLVNNSISTANKVRSISLPGSNMDTTGVGGKGLSHWIANDGSMVFQVQWDNGIKQLLRADWQ